MKKQEGGQAGYIMVKRRVSSLRVFLQKENCKTIYSECTGVVVLVRDVAEETPHIEGACKVVIYSLSHTALHSMLQALVYQSLPNWLMCGSGKR